MNPSEPARKRSAPSDPLGAGFRDRRGPDGLADVLERVLDRGIVVAGDVQLNLLDIEVLTLKVRLLVASADTAQQMGVDWWKEDPFLSREKRDLVQENRALRERLGQLEEESDGRDGGARASPRDRRGDVMERLTRLEEVVARSIGPTAREWGEDPGVGEASSDPEPEKGDAGGHRDAGSEEDSGHDE